MKVPIESLAAQVKSGRNFDSPPLHLWHPPLLGDISIRIDSQGAWYHDGDVIKRESLIRLFASILRREEDGDYYLVTPNEKWRIEVESHPLVVIDVDIADETERQLLEATLNTGKRILVSSQYPLFLDTALGGIAALHLPHGLTALCTRAAWYRLLNFAILQDGRAVLRSGEFEIDIPMA